MDAVVRRLSDPAARRELARQVAAGSRFIAYGIDSVFLWQGAERPGVENQL